MPSIRRISPFTFNPYGLIFFVAIILLIPLCVQCMELEISPSFPKKCTRLGRRFLTSDDDNNRNLRRASAEALQPQEILPRLKAAATFRDNIVTALGSVLLLCLTENTRVPFERIHDAVRTRVVPVYELLILLPIVKNKIPRQQLYSVLQMLERIGNRYISEYAALCIESLSGGSVPMEKVMSIDILQGIDNDVIESIRNDNLRRPKPPLTFNEAFAFLMKSLNGGTLQPGLNIVAGIMQNIPNFNFNDPEVPDSLRFVAESMEQMANEDKNDLIEYFSPTQLEKPDQLVKEVLVRLEVANLPSATIKEAISILIQSLDVPSYPKTPQWKENLKDLFKITTDYYNNHAVAVATYLYKQLNKTDSLDLDIAFFEEGTQALLQVLIRLQKRPKFSFLGKVFSILRPFVSQHAWYESLYNEDVPISFFEINRYLDSLDIPCLPKNVTEAGRNLRPLLTENLPWAYAIGSRISNGNPWVMVTNALIHLRSTPINEKQALLMDNYIYQIQSKDFDKKRNLLYDLGIIFQREDSLEVEIDIYSLLMRIPNIFKEERFVPMLNFFSRPNLLTLLGHEFNKFKFDKPRHLLVSLLDKIISLSAVQSDTSLITVMKSAKDYLEQPLLVNMYTSEDLQLLLRLLPRVEEDARYLPLKILFRKRKLFSYLSPSFSLANIDSPIKHLELILSAVSLKTTHKKLLESIQFALSNIESQPVSPRPYNYDDFVYLVNYFLSDHQAVKDTILKQIELMQIDSWNLYIGGTPEEVLVRTINKLATLLQNNNELKGAVKTAEKILEEKLLVDVSLLKKRTLEAMLEYLPDNSYVKPVNLLLKKSNLMLLVPKLNITSVESAESRDALITLIKALTDSPNVRAQKTLLRRLRSTLRHAELADKSNRHSSLASYLVQILRNPDDPIYSSLLTELKNVKNVDIQLEDREKILKDYLNAIRQNGKTNQLRISAEKALEELTYTFGIEIMPDVDNKMLRQALSLLPNDAVVDPLRKLLTVTWVRGILPSNFKTTNFPEIQTLLKAILFYAKQRVDIAENPSLMQGISKMEKILGGWKADVKPLRKIVASIKSAIYDPIKNLLSAASLNKLSISVPTAKVSVKTKLLTVLNNLFIHPTIKKNEKIRKTIGAVIEDINNFGVSKDLLSVLDNMGVPYTPELIPLRIFLHKDIISDRYSDVFKYEKSRERFNVLINHLRSDKEVKKHKKLANALKIIKSSSLIEIKTGATVSDLLDIVNVIPDDVKTKYPDVSNLFNRNILSLLPNKQRIVDTQNPVMALLEEISRLPVVMINTNLSNSIVKVYKKLINLSIDPVVTGFHLRPLLRELSHVQNINVDFVNQIIDPDVLRYLHAPDFSDLADDQVETLRFIIHHILSQEIVKTDDELKDHVKAISRDLQLVMGPGKVSKQGISKQELKALMHLIPRQKAYTPLRIFIQSSEIFQYLGYARFKQFWKPQKKLMHLLKVLDASDLPNDNLKQSIKMLRRHLQIRFNFITEEQAKSLYRELSKLKINYNVTPLKIFLNHDNLIKYLPRTFRYNNYSTTKKALAAILQILGDVPALQNRSKLQEVIKVVRKELQPKQRMTNVFRKALTHKSLKIKDLKFIKALKITSPALKAFFEPQKLLVILPSDFSFANRSTFKLKALHLLHQLLLLKTPMQKELKLLFKTVQSMPDVPNIDVAHLQLMLDLIPDRGIPNIKLLKKYMTLSRLRQFLPGTFAIDKNDPRKSLRDMLLVLNIVLGAVKDQKLQVAIDTLHTELVNRHSKLVPTNSTISAADINSLLVEIPFKKYDVLKPLEKRLEPSSVIAALPLNFNLMNSETKKLRVLALLEQVSRNKKFQNSLDSIKYAKKVIGAMPDGPKINSTDISRLLEILPLDAFYLKHLQKSCNVRTLAPFLPIYFDIHKFKSRKQKITQVVKYCEMSNPMDISTRQALDNLKEILNHAPGLDICEDEVRSMINEIPCTSFAQTKPLKLYLLKNEILPYIPWNLDIHSQKSYKARVEALVKGLRNVRPFQTNEIFTALSALEVSAKNMPNNPPYKANDVQKMKEANPLSDYKGKNCGKSFEWEESLKYMPPTMSSFNGNYKILTFLFVTYSAFWPRLRDNEEFMTSCSYVKSMLLNGAKPEMIKRLRESREVNSQIPLKLHLQAWGNQLFTTINRTEWNCNYHWKCYYSYERDMITLNVRSILKVLSDTYWVTKSKALTEAIDTAQLMLLNHPTGFYEIEEIIGEIPSSEKYDGIRLLFGCTNMVDRYMHDFGTSQKDTPPKKMLLNMLYEVKQTDVDFEQMQLIKALIGNVERAVHDWEAEQMFKLLPDYSYHLTKLEPVRSYYILHGADEILGIDYATKYPDTKSKLKALHKALTVLPLSKLTSELKESLDYLDKAMHNKITVQRKVNRSVKDINVKALFAALPKTRDEKIIMGALKFFSDPNLLDNIHLGKSPFEYQTKGNLLQAILDRGLEMQSVQNDPLQQDALEFFRDKIVLTGPSAQPIELKITAENSNRNIDLLDLLKALNLNSANVAEAAGKVTLFFEKQYNSDMYAVGFDQMAYTTRGTYLKAFLEFLLEKTEVQNDIKNQIKVLIPAVKFDGDGAALIDFYDDNMPDNRMFDDKLLLDSDLKTKLALNASLDSIIPILIELELFRRRNEKNYSDASQFLGDRRVLKGIRKIKANLKASLDIMIKLPFLNGVLAANLNISSGRGRGAGGAGDGSGGGGDGDGNAGRSSSGSGNGGGSNDNGDTRRNSLRDILQQYALNEEFYKDIPDENTSTKEEIQNRMDLERIPSSSKDTKDFDDYSTDKYKDNDEASGGDSVNGRKKLKNKDESKSQIGTDEEVDSATFAPSKILFNYDRRLAETIPEGATFHPHKMLVNLKSSRLGTSNMSRKISKEGKYVTMDEAEKLTKNKRKLVRPITTEDFKLPEPEIHETFLSHEPKRKHLEVNLQNRKLFFRPDTSVDVDYLESSGLGNTAPIRRTLGPLNDNFFEDYAEELDKGPLDTTSTEHETSEEIRKIVKKDLGRVTSKNNVTPAKTNGKKKKSDKATLVTKKKQPSGKQKVNSNKKVKDEIMTKDDTSFKLKKTKKPKQGKGKNVKSKLKRNSFRTFAEGDLKSLSKGSRKAKSQQKRFISTDMDHPIEYQDQFHPNFAGMERLFL